MFALVLLLPGCASPAKVSPASTPPTTGSTGHEELDKAVERTAEELLQEKSSFVIEPQVELIQPSTATEPPILRYRLGKVHLPALADALPDPFATAVSAHVQRALFQKALGGSAVPPALWTEPLSVFARVERLSVQGGLDADSAQLAKLNQDIEAALAGVDAGLKKHAESLGAIALRDEQDNPLPRGGFPVAIETIPAGGKVRLIKYLTYAKERHRGMTEDQVTWLTLLGKRENLMGRYRYWVTWVDGRGARGTIEVGAAVETITFQPD